MDEWRNDRVVHTLKKLTALLQKLVNRQEAKSFNWWDDRYLKKHAPVDEWRNVRVVHTLKKHAL